MTIVSTPANPGRIAREIDTLRFEADERGMAIHGLPAGCLALSTVEALALVTFIRSPGVARLIARAWLAEQHADYIAE